MSCPVFNVREKRSVMRPKVLDGEWVAIEDVLLIGDLSEIEDVTNEISEITIGKGCDK